MKKIELFYQKFVLNLKTNLIFLFFTTIFFSIDRFTKFQIIEKFSDRKFFINDYLNLDLIWNTGIGFGLLSFDQSLIYTSITLFIGIVIIILFYIAIIGNVSEKIMYSLIIGGAIGNFYDRLAFNAVPDFIDLHYNNFHWFTFNFADIFITIGIIFLLTKSIFVKNDTV